MMIVILIAILIIAIVCLSITRCEKYDHVFEHNAPASNVKMLNEFGEENVENSLTFGMLSPNDLDKSDNMNETLITDSMPENIPHDMVHNKYLEECKPDGALKSAYCHCLSTVMQRCPPTSIDPICSLARHNVLVNDTCDATMILKNNV